MDHSMSMHRHGLENMDLNQYQGDANKINSSVLRGIEGNTLHFITIPRTNENEYIDHALLSPEYITAHIQNGMVVDIIQSQSHDQQSAIASHNIYNSETIEQNASPLEMTTDRHFIGNNDSVQIPMENIHQSLSSSHNSLQSGHLSHRNHYSIDNDRKVSISEQNRQYILTNEAPVIVSNKEATAMAMNDLDLSNSFSSTFNQIDSSRINDDDDIDEKIQTNSLPPLPPLTPISKLQSMRKTPTIEQQALQYKTAIHSSASINLPKSNTILKNACFVSEEDEVNFVQSNLKMIRQSSKEHSIAPKKNLPHKKRITKKLKSISPSIEQMQAIETTYHLQQDMTHLQGHSQHDQYSISNQQNETLNLTLNQQPMQLTTSRTNQNTTEYIQSDHFANASDATNSIHSVQLQQISITESPHRAIQTARFACEICGMQAQTQLSFFHHLKLHYEPEIVTNAQNCTKIDEIRTSTNIASTLALEQNDSDIFQMNDEQKINTSQCITSQSMNVPVIMTDNFVRLQSNEQDFSCMPGIGNEDVTDDESINGYNDTGLSGIKSEQNEFSDTEDMLENGVLDKVQRVVDSYIENGTNDVKNLIDMNENQHHSCSWTASNNSVYAVDKTEPVNNNNFVMSSSNHGKQTAQNTQIHSINNQAVIGRPEELTLIYEINMNDKDFQMMDDASTESILRRQLARPETPSNTVNPNHFDQIETTATKSSMTSMEREITTFINESAESTPTKINIQDEFIEEEQTDSDVDPDKPDAQKKKKKIFRCKRCNKLCNSKNALHYHFLSHTGLRPHKCGECGKSFFASSALKVHKRLHSGDKPYNCEFCNRPFRQWGDLKYHIQSKHTKEKSHQCEFCGKDFARRYSLVIHRRIHTGEKNYKCEFCDKEFRASSYLQVHRKIHTGEKPFVCDVCGKRFRVKGDLKRHSNIHERNKTRDAKIEDLSCMSNGSSSGKNEMFIIDDNNTLQSRSTDTLDQLVSVIESTDAALANENTNDSQKKRNFMQIGYDKDLPKTKRKRDSKTDTPDDYSSAILDYSTDHLIGKTLTFGNGNEKNRIRHH